MSNGPHVQTLQRSDAAEMEEVFRLLEAERGFLSNDLLAMANRPDLLRAVVEFSRAVYDEATLQTGLLCLVSLSASIAAQSPHGIASAAYRCHRAGIEPEKIAAIWEHGTSPLFDERERLALDFAHGAALGPSPLRMDDFDAMRGHFSETEITEILMVVGETGFFNRWNNAVATSVEDEPLAFAQTHLAGRVAEFEPE